MVGHAGSNLEGFGDGYEAASKDMEKELNPVLMLQRIMALEKQVSMLMAMFYLQERERRAKIGE